MRKNLFYVSVLLISLVVTACGSGGGGGGGSTDYGGDINYGFEIADISCTGTETGGTYTSGDFQVDVATGTMDPCVNAVAPAATSVSTLPSGLDISDNEYNITDGTTAGYQFTLGADTRSFNFSDVGGVTITVPYDLSSVPGPVENSTRIFVRILDHLTNLLVDVTGELDTVNDTITIDLMGLPSTMTVVAIYNPNMVAHASDDTANPSISGLIGVKAMPTTWAAQRWCVVYDSASTENLAELATYRDNTGDPTATMEDMMENQVARWAVRAQNEYTAADFRQPAIISFSGILDPCGNTLVPATTPRFNIHVQSSGSEFSISGSDGVVDVRGNHYGRLYVGSTRLNLSINDNLGTVYASIAHEMLHGIHYGYDFNTWAATLLGYDEGTASTYGRTLAMNWATVNTTPYPRPDSSQEFKLTTYIGQSSANDTASVDGTAYSNQDFFAYVGREYNSDSLSYLAGLFEQIKSEIVTAAGTNPVFGFQPPRTVIIDAMDIYFQGNFAGQPTLRQVYIDFIRQRAMEHNENSWFRSADVPYRVSGELNTTLFTSGGLVNAEIDPLAVVGSSGRFTNLAPFAARAIVITPSQAIEAGGTGATITVTLTPASGTTLDGAVYMNEVYQQAASTTNTFSNFGMAATDEIVILLANVANSASYGAVSFAISGTNGSGSGGGGGGQSIFNLTTFDLPDEGDWTPTAAFIAPDYGSGVIDGMIMSSLTEGVRYKSLQVQMGTSPTTGITGVGTYIIIGDDPLSAPAAIAYSPGTDYALTNKVFTSYNGSITIDEWNTAVGQHIRGSFNAGMQTGETPNITGTIAADFDFVVGSYGELQ